MSTKKIERRERLHQKHTVMMETHIDDGKPIDDGKHSDDRNTQL